MNTEHPITPPLKLVREWQDIWNRATIKDVSNFEFVATQAARWGADMELEACCEWLRSSLPGYDKHYADYLRAARRPKPPSLKEQALALLDDASDRLDAVHENTIRRALEALPDD